MATTFTWSVQKLERNISDGGVHHAAWLCDASETIGTGDDAVTYTSRVGGKTEHTPDPSASDFIAYKDITEADVIGWVQAVTGKSDTETQLQAMIDEKKTPTTATGVPW